MNLKLFFPILAFVPFCAAQEMWELGAVGGYGFTRNATISSPAGSASAGLRNGLAFGFMAGASERKYIGAEAGYVYRAGDLKLSGNSHEPAFSGQTHFADFRFLVHFSPIQRRVRPFVAVGGGVAVYMGSGVESSTQPLNNIAALTNTQQTKPMASAAVGLKARVSEHVALRFEFRDYMTPFPDQVIAPVPGASVSGWLHNFVPMVGITGVF